MPFDPPLSNLVVRIKTLAKVRARILVGVAGAPGSGKSTLAEALVDDLGPEACVLPMDGFHLPNKTLVERGLLARKGAPETFDADGFIALLRKVRSTPEVTYPTFDRTLDATVPDAGVICAGTRIVVAEGNYLLLKAAPWSETAACLDLSVQLDVPRDTLEARLIQRWRDHGHSEEAAILRARGNDLRNADVVLTASRPADVTLRQSAT